MAFDGSEEQRNGEDTPPPAAETPPIDLSPHEFPPLIPPATREPWWLLAIGLFCYMALLGLIWSNHAADKNQGVDFQQSVSARLNTRFIELIQYHRLRGELPGLAMKSINIEELATQTARDWRSISDDTTDAGQRGLTALNAAALYHLAGDDASARRMLVLAAKRDSRRAMQYRALSRLYDANPRPVPETPAISGKLRKITAGPLVRARNAELLGDSAAALAALQPGARAGQRVVLVTVVSFMAMVALLLGLLVALIVARPRLARPLSEVEQGPGAEVPWGMGTGLIVISLSYFAVSFILSLLGSMLSAPKDSDAELMLGLIANLLGPLLIISLFLIALGRKPWEWGVLGWLPTRRGMRYGITALALSLPLIIVAGIVSRQIFGDQQGTNPLIPEIVSAHNPLLLAMLILTAVVVAPLVEETLFRGILFRAANTRLPFWTAAFGSGFLFAAGHYLLVALLPITLLGVLFALLTRRSQSLFASAAAHAGYNGMVTVVMLLLAWALRG